VDIANAIGAGDTFLAALVCAYLEAGDPFKAAEQAARFTEAVLQERADSVP
jgi:sugar/nucleoside kinase (ribokinase family)